MSQSPCCAGTRSLCWTWRSVPTARSWPRRAWTGRCASGTCRPDPPGRCCAATGTGSSASRTARMAACWPLLAGTRPYGCGTRRRTKLWRSCRTTAWATAWPSAPTARRLAAGCADNSIRLWDVATARRAGGKELLEAEVAELRGHEDYVHAVAWSPDGTRLLSASGDHTVRVWDSLSAQERARRAAR